MCLREAREHRKRRILYNCEDIEQLQPFLESDGMAARRRRRAPQATEYVEGNTVRKIERAPQYEEQERRKQKKRNSSHTVTVRRNQEKALQMNLFSVLLLTAAMICTLYICVSYLKLQSSVTARLNHIESLEESIEKLKGDNDALLTRINTSVDLDYVYKVATEELGMVYANKDQVRLYNKTESEYVRQYEDIPER